MATPKSSSIIAAANDSDLLARAVALGATLGLSQTEVESQRTRLASLPVDGAGNTVASVYEYAATVHADAVRALPPAPGKNPSAVTDEFLVHALNLLKDGTA